MQLTPLQQLVLARYWKWHTEGMTLKKLTVLYSGRWLLFLGVIGLAAMLAPETPLMAGVAVGFFLGQIVRDVRELLNALQMWPLLERLIDWKVTADVIAGEE
jgi:hypothetical protein